MRNLFRAQPTPFYLVFLIEIWERFGFYALNVMLVFFMVQSMKMTDELANYRYGNFIALVYLLPVLGGYIGDKVLGTRRTIILGQLLLWLGYILLSIPFVTHYSLAFPLTVIAVGSGFFKPNPSSLLSKVYEGTNYNRDGGFTLFYMGINIGGLLSTAFVPILSRELGWYAGFLASAIGLGLANITYFMMRKTVACYGSDADLHGLSIKKIVAVFLLTILLLAVCYFLLDHHDLLSWLLGIGIVGFLGFFIYHIFLATPQERKGMVLFLVLFFQAIIFFVLFFQIPMSLNLFALRNVDHHLLGFTLHPAQFQSLNSLWIFIMSPVMAWVYHKLAMQRKDVGLPAKFALGTLLIGVAFLVIPAVSVFNHTGVVSAGWMVLVYWFISVAELLVSALGLSLVARYIPQRLMGYCMGLWCLCISIAGMLAGRVSAIASIPKDITSDPLLSLPIYNHLFLWLGGITVMVGLILFIFVPLLNRLVYGFEKKETVN